MAPRGRVPVQALVPGLQGRRHSRSCSDDRSASRYCTTLAGPAASRKNSPGTPMRARSCLTIASLTQPTIRRKVRLKREVFTRARFGTECSQWFCSAPRISSRVPCFSGSTSFF